MLPVSPRSLNNRRILAGLRAGKSPIANLSRLELYSPERRKADLAYFLEVRGGFFYGKVGTTELLALEYSDRWLRPFWPAAASWQRPAERLYVDSGVFPVTRGEFKNFLTTYRASVADLDGICLWQDDPFLRHYEKVLAAELCPRARRITYLALTSRVLEELAGLRWLVVSSFTKSMRIQSPKLAEIHRGKPWARRLQNQERAIEFLACPTFASLAPSPYQSWSDGLDRLTEAACRVEFDVALVGAGAWSLPLLSNLKKAGKKGIHLGGETQLVFGIKGRRWDHEGIYNEAWVRPDPLETPAGFMKKENGCYW